MLQSVLWWLGQFSWSPLLLSQCFWLKWQAEDILQVVRMQLENCTFGWPPWLKRHTRSRERTALQPRRRKRRENPRQQNLVGAVGRNWSSCWIGWRFHRCEVEVEVVLLPWHWLSRFIAADCESSQDVAYGHLWAVHSVFEDIEWSDPRARHKNTWRSKSHSWQFRAGQSWSKGQGRAEGENRTATESLTKIASLSFCQIFDTKCPSATSAPRNTRVTSSNSSGQQRV